jgi:hypothetical protein
MEEKKVNITLGALDIVTMLMHQTNISEDLARVIVGNLCHSSGGLDQLVKALMGVFPTLKYEVGDFVYISVDTLQSWKVDRDATRKLSICKDDMIMAQVTETDKYNSSPYRIKATAVLTGGEIGQTDQVIPESYIKGVPEDPTEILDLIEELNTPKDLPF